jgi:quercetin dioxygenase-like cupin family protein
MFFTALSKRRCGMIKEAAAMQEEIRQQMRGGKGEVKIRHLFGEGEYRGHTRLMAKVTLAPGCSIGPHEHKEEEEVFYIIKGRGLATDDGATREVGPGDAIITGGGGCHAIENNGCEALEFIAVILTY